jgi:hypothetical protein
VERAVVIDLLPELTCLRPQCLTGHLNNDLVEGIGCAEQLTDSNHPLIADCAHLNGIAVIHQSEKRGDPHNREVDVRCRRTSPDQHLIKLELHGLQMPGKPVMVVRREARQEIIAGGGEEEAFAIGDLGGCP